MAISAAGDNAWFPIVASLRGGRIRLAYEQRIVDTNIWAMEVADTDVKAFSPRSLIASTRGDITPQLSPDGRRVVFASDRSGYSENLGMRPGRVESHAVDFAKKPLWNAALVPRWVSHCLRLARRG